MGLISYKDLKSALPEISRPSDYLISFSNTGNSLSVNANQLNMISGLYSLAKSADLTEYEVETETISLAYGYEIEIPTNLSQVKRLDVVFVDDGDKKLRKIFRKWVLNTPLHNGKSIAIMDIIKYTMQIEVITTDVTKKEILSDKYQVFPLGNKMLLDSTANINDELPISFLVIGMKLG